MTGSAIPTVVRCVVVNYNGGGLVQDCVRSVVDQVPRQPAGQGDGQPTQDPPSWSLQVVVVDNASTDGSPDRLAATFGTALDILRNPTNEGYVAANAGLGHLDGRPDPDLVALVNPDATLEPGCLDALVGALGADASLGAVSPCMLFAHRFVEVTLRAEPEPRGRDPRPLAVQLWGVRSDGAERLGQLWAGPGVGDGEEHGGRAFRWLGPEATVGVPLALHSGSASGASTAALTLSSPTPKAVEVGGTTVRIGPAPTTVEVPLDPAPAVERIANAGSQVFDDGTGADRGHFAPLGPPYDTSTDLFAWCGGGVLLRAAYLADVGVFEPSLFLYYEDTDLSWRGRARGWRYRYVPEARMRHVQGASGGAGSDRFVVSTTRNRLVVAVRNAPRRVVWRAVGASLGELWSSLRHEVLVPLTRLRRPATRMARLRLRGLVAALVALPAAVAARRRLGRSATVDRATVARGLVPRRGPSRGPRPGHDHH